MLLTKITNKLVLQAELKLFLLLLKYFNRLYIFWKHIS